MIRTFSKEMSIKFINCRILRHFFLRKKLPSTLTKSCFPKAYFHSSCYQLNEIQPENTSVEEIKKPVRLSAAEARKIAYWTVDWLPFPFKPRIQHNPFQDSGDLVKEIEYDPSWPKPDFEFSDELKTANDEIKHMYSLATASKGEIKEVVKRRWFAKLQRHPNDLDSIEVIIALKTLQIRSLFEHSKNHKKDIKGSRRILDIMIKKRNRDLKSLYRLDIDRFNWICKELKLTYKPQMLGGIREFYCKKWDLRRLTREYCAKMLKDKKNAYHEELKRHQADFLKEKEEALIWMEKEKEEIFRITKELESLTV